MPCKWYITCPIKYYTDNSISELYWLENYPDVLGQKLHPLPPRRKRRISP